MIHKHPRAQFLQDDDSSSTTPINNWKYSVDHQDFLQFRPNPYQNEGDDSISNNDSGANSPPLWKNINDTTSLPSPSKSPSQPLLSNQHHNSVNYRSLSPDSRTQAIVRGQWELMEMVKNMPESSYELSLKDLVEHNRLENNNNNNQEKDQPQSNGPGFSRFSDNNQNLNRRRGGFVVKKQESKRYHHEVRKGGFENNKGLFLNVVSPFFSLKSSKKRVVAGGGGVGSGRGDGGGKVSPKPEVIKSGNFGGAEKDWWKKKKMSGSSDSDSSRASNNTFGSSIGSSESSGSNRSYSNSRKRNGYLTGCLSFLRSRKSRSAE